MTSNAEIHVWPNLEKPFEPPGNRGHVLIIDLRPFASEVDTFSRLEDLAGWCVERFAELSLSVAPVAVVIRHEPAPSGRTSSTMLGELGICGVRGFVRQMRYDRKWREIPLNFVDARNAGDEEIKGLVTALLAGQTRIDVDRSSGRTAGAFWKKGDGL